MSLELSIEHTPTQRPAAALTSAAGVAELFAPLVADSTALVWIKDLEGRYLHVNPRHAEQLGVDELRIRGLTDADLRPGQAIDGRLANYDAADAEHFEAEYTIEAYQERPALAALRFPIHGADGEPLAICGVAAPVRDAAVARRERARLVELDRAPQRTDRDLWRDDPRAPNVKGEAGDKDLGEPQAVSLRSVEDAPSQAPAADPTAHQSPDQSHRVEQLGVSLTAAGDRVQELERLLVDARGPFEELARLIEEARHAQAAAVESTGRLTQLEQRLGEIMAEMEVVRKAHARDAVALSAESQLRSEWEARAEEALGRVDALEASLAEVRARNYQLQNTVAHAEVSVATSSQEANSARLRAEAARLDAEAARLEAEAYRQDVETAKLEAESSRHDVELAQQEANRFRLAAEAAFEQMHAVRGEWETAQGASAPARDVDPYPSDADTPLAGSGFHRPDDADAPQNEVSSLDAVHDHDSVEAVEVATGEGSTNEADYQEAEVDEPTAAAEHPEAEAQATEPSVESEYDSTAADAAEAQPPAETEAWEPAGEPAGDSESLRFSDERATESAGGETDGAEVEPEDADAQAPIEDSEAQSTETGDVAAVPLPAIVSSPLTWTTSAKLSLTAALVDCNSSRTIFAEAVRVIGSRGGWDSVIAWTLDTRAKRYAVTAMWCATDEMAAFETAIRQLRQDTTESALGRVAAGGQIRWFGDPGADGDANLARAASEGMNLVVVLPVLHEGETVAVLELCSRHAGEPDEALRTALEAMASELIFVQQLLSASESTRWPVWRRR